MSLNPMSPTINEDDVLALLKDTFSHREPLLNDAAVLPSMPDQTIVCSDNVVEGIHYRGSAAPEVVANLLLTRVVSDQAACGALPHAITLNFILSATMTPAYLAAMIVHLNTVCEKLNIRLLGGDTSITPAKTSCYSVTCFGSASHFLRRDLAVDGQLVYVTGVIGDAYTADAIAMKRLVPGSDMKRLVPGSDTINEYFRTQPTRFTPRVDVMQELSAHIDCAIDISDGLLRDAHTLGSASDKVIILFHDDIPTSPEMKEMLAPLTPQKRAHHFEKSLTWGGDYEVLFTTYASNAPLIAQTMKEFGVPLTCIGYVGKSSPSTTQFVSLRNHDNCDITPKKLGFTHGMDNVT